MSTPKKNKLTKLANSLKLLIMHCMPQAKFIYLFFYVFSLSISSWHVCLSVVYVFFYFICHFCSLIPFHSFTLFTHFPFPLLYAFNAYTFSPQLRILRILLHNFFQHKYRRIKSLCCKSCTS